MLRRPLRRRAPRRCRRCLHGATTGRGLRGSLIAYALLWRRVVALKTRRAIAGALCALLASAFAALTARALGAFAALWSVVARPFVARRPVTRALVAWRCILPARRPLARRARRRLRFRVDRCIRDAVAGQVQIFVVGRHRCAALLAAALGGAASGSLLARALRSALARAGPSFAFAAHTGVVTLRVLPRDRWRLGFARRGGALASARG